MASDLSNFPPTMQCRILWPVIGPSEAPVSQSWLRAGAYERHLRHSGARGEPQSDPGHCRVKISLLLDMMKANPKYGQLLVKTFEKYKNIEYLNPHDEIKCIKNDMFHDIRVKVKRQDSTYHDVHLGDLFGS